MDLYTGEYQKRSLNSVFNLPAEIPEKTIKIPVMKDRDGDNGFILNEQIKVQQSQMLFLEFEEDILKPFELFHGQFVLFGTEIENENNWKHKYNCYEPYKLSFKLTYPRRDGSLAELTEEIHIYKYIRRHYPNGNAYPFQSHGQTYPSHTYIEFWGVPDYVIKLMRFPLKQRSFKDKTYGEILEDILKEFDIKCNSPNYKHEQKYKISDIKILNKQEIQEPLVIPQGVNFFNFLEWLRLRLWQDKEDFTSFPFIYFNHGNLNILIPNVSPSNCGFKLYLGDKWTEISSVNESGEQVINKFIDKINKDYVLEYVEYVSRNRGTIFNILQNRHEKFLFQGNMEEKLPFKWKKLRSMNSFIPEPTFCDIKKEYKDYWEYDQFYIDEEMNLEDRMGLMYNTFLYNYYYNMDYFITGFNNFLHQEMLEKLPLGLQFVIKLWDSQFTGKDEYSEEIKQIVQRRQHFIVPAQQYWQVMVELQTDSKWNIFKEDRHEEFPDKQKSQCKENEKKSYTR